MVSILGFYARARRKKKEARQWIGIKNGGMHLRLEKGIALTILTGLVTMTAAAMERTVEDFNDEWSFNLGDISTAEQVEFDDAGWHKLRLPHDWSVAQSFTQENAGGATGFLPGGIGWYRKTFSLPESARGRVARIEFDGVYTNSKVWLNGHLLGNRPYGYAPFSYDLTPFLNYGNNSNVISVRVDRSAYLDCRWYPGSGIYRNVRLVLSDPWHIPQWGLCVTTPKISDSCATVSIKTTIKNAGGDSDELALRCLIMDPAGRVVVTAETPLGVNASEPELLLKVDNPLRWDIDSPNRYRAKSELLRAGQVVDSAEVFFGIRAITYDAAKGFFLNGRPVLFKGVCLHHDGGCVGAAVPLDVWRRRLTLLKEAGCNAIRTAHNPPSEEFLDLCDEMGFLVQDEAFDEWDNPKDKRHNFNQQSSSDETRGYTEHFAEWQQADLEAMVRRDRNHPSIVMWSIGNEIEWTYPRYQAAAGYWDGTNESSYYYTEPAYAPEKMKQIFDEKGPAGPVLADTARRLARWTKALDATRPVTANLVIPSVSHWSGYTEELDLIGYSYRTVMYDYGHRNYPEKMIYGAENWALWDEWRAALEKEYMPGIFIWTGIDYLGESRAWPAKSSNTGLLDSAGFKKPAYYFMKSLWCDEPMVHIATSTLKDSHYITDPVTGSVVDDPDNTWSRQWVWSPLNAHWNYEQGESVYVEIYTNADEVELFVNGVSAGTRQIEGTRDHFVQWAVPFAAGDIRAVARTNGSIVSEQVIQTAGEPVAVTLSVDKKSLTADGRAVVHCVAQLVDAKGRAVRHANQRVSFKITGDAVNIGVDNGHFQSTQDYRADGCVTSAGKCLMVLQAGRTTGEIQIEATGAGLGAGAVRISQQKQYE